MDSLIIHQGEDEFTTDVMVVIIVLGRNCFGINTGKTRAQSLVLEIALMIHRNGVNFKRNMMVVVIVFRLTSQQTGRLS